MILKNIGLFLVKTGFVLLSLMLPYSISVISVSTSLIFVGYTLFCVSEKRLVLPKIKDVKIVVYLMFLFLCIMLVSTIFSSDVISSVKRLVTVAGYFFIFVSIFLLEDRKFCKQLLYIFLFSCFIHSVYAIAQYFTGVDIVSKGYQKYNRVIGIVGHFNSLAGILGLVFPVIFCFSYFVKQYRLFYIIVGITIFLATVLTFTRGVWLGMFLSLIAIGMLSDKKIITAGVIFILILFLIPEAKKRIINTFITEETARKQFLKLTPKMLFDIPERLVLGFGPDSFKKVFYERHPDFVEKGHFHPHNMYLHLLFETGVAGLGVFLIMFYFVIKNLFNLFTILQDFDKILVLGVIGSVVVFLSYGLVDEPFRAHFAPYVEFFLLSLGFKMGEFVQK